MKKIFLSIILGFTALFGFTQDLDEINEMMGKSKFGEARTAIDKFLAVQKNADNSEAWYYKGRIYSSLSYDSTLPAAQRYTLKSDAFEAFKKNQQLDPKDIRMLFETHNSYLDLYFGLYDLGVTQFNAKNYDAAYETFKKAHDVKDYILSKKYEYSQAKLYPLDTALVMNVAQSAVQGKKDSLAVIYFQKLVDANVAGKEHEGVYEYLVDYYNKKNDKISLQSTLEKAKRLYPKNMTWTELELRTISNKGDKAALFAKYDEMLEKDAGNFALAYNYAVELYNSIVGKNAKSADDPVAKEKLTSVLKIAIAADTGIDATVLMTNHLFNMAADLWNASNLIKSSKPQEVKTKSELKAKATVKMDQMISYAETALKYFEGRKPLKEIQKANYKIILNSLSDIYNLKNNPKKAAEYEAKNKAADKM